jgi:hypothetical protein
MDDLAPIVTDSTVSLVLRAVSSSELKRSVVTIASRDSLVLKSVTCLGNGESDPGRRSAAGAHGALVTVGRT